MKKQKISSVKLRENKANALIKKSLAFQTKRGVFEEPTNLPVCYSPVTKRSQPSDRYHSSSKREDKSLFELSPKTEKEMMMDEALLEHKKVMRKVYKERLQNRINSSMISHYDQNVIKKRQAAKEKFLKESSEIKPARLFNPTEIEDEYQIYLKEKIESELSSQTDSTNNAKYHEGMIPRQRNNNQLTAEPKYQDPNEEKKEKERRRLSKGLIAINLPKSVYKNLSGRVVEKLQNLLDFKKRQQINEELEEAMEQKLLKANKNKK